MHRMADEVAAATRIPLLHIADPTAAKIKAAGFSRVGLLGTGFTMEQDFYKGRLQKLFGLDVLVPEAEDRRVVHDIIYRELVAGEVRVESRMAYRAVMARLIARGAQAIVLGHSPCPCRGRSCSDPGSPSGLSRQNGNITNS
jgi:aspartate racemase